MPSGVEGVGEIEVAAHQGDRETAGRRIPDLIAEMLHITESIQLANGKKSGAG